MRTNERTSIIVNSTKICKNVCSIEFYIIFTWWMELAYIDDDWKKENNDKLLKKQWMKRIINKRVSISTPIVTNSAKIIRGTHKELMNKLYFKLSYSLSLCVYHTHICMCTLWVRCMSINKLLKHTSYTYIYSCNRERYYVSVD